MAITGANRIRTVLSQTLSQGSTATLRAKVRWLKGHPEILLRLHGNWLEAAGEMLTTRAFGSPGGVNSRYRNNAGPAITDVSHWPVLPAAGQGVTVAARIQDPDGLTQAVLKYRLDPSSNYVTAAMINRGAGLFSAVIPAQSAGTRVAFYVEARDAFTPGATSRFPDRRAGARVPGWFRRNHARRKLWHVSALGFAAERDPLDHPRETKQPSA